MKVKDGYVILPNGNLVRTLTGPAAAGDKPANATMTVNTKCGELTVTACADPNYPGFAIEVERDREDMTGTYMHLVCAVEVNKATGELIVHVWADPDNEDCTHNISVGLR